MYISFGYNRSESVESVYSSVIMGVRVLKVCIYIYPLVIIGVRVFRVCIYPLVIIGVRVLRVCILG